MKKKLFFKTTIIILLSIILTQCAPMSDLPPTQETNVQIPPTQESQQSESQESQTAEEQNPTESIVVTPEFDWKKYSGASIKVITNNHKIQDSVYVANLAEFEELTGIKVDMEIMDSSSLRSTLPVQLTARSTEFDVMASMTAVDGLQFSANGWYEPLDDYINNPELTNPEWDFEDFPLGIREAMKADGKTVAIWWESQTSLFYFRKSILEENGLDVPKTFSEWLTLAEKVNKPAKEFYGVALRGAGIQVTTPFAPFLYGYCGSWLDENGNASINTKEAVDAFEMYGKLGSQYGPPGITAFDWQEPAQQFAQGNVATFLDINLFLPTLEASEQSRVAGDVGYALVPEGPCGRTPFVAGWGWSINPLSENKDAAWYFIQWATSKDNNLRAILAGLPSPRTSAWESADFKNNDKFPDYTMVNLESFQSATALMNPPINPGLQAREIVGYVGVLALQGATRDEIQDAADKANEELQALIEEMRAANQ